MISVHISGCEHEAMADRIEKDPRLTDLLINVAAVIMTECHPGVSTCTPELEERVHKIQDILITAFALFESNQWPSRHIGQS